MVTRPLEPREPAPQQIQIDDYPTFVSGALQPREEHRITAPASWQLAPENDGLLAVQAGQYIFLYQQTDPRAAALHPRPIKIARYQSMDLERAIPWAFAQRISTLLLLDAQDASMLGTHNLVHRDYEWHELSSRGAGGGGMAATLAGVVCRQRVSNRLLVIHFLTAADPWQLLSAGRLLQRPEAERAQLIALAWLLAAHTLHIRLRFSPSYTGRQLVQALLARKQAADFEPVPPEYQRLWDEARAFTPAWVRPVRPRGQTTGGVEMHVYDRNWSFVTAAGVAECVTGAPRQLPPELWSQWPAQMRAWGICRIDAVAPVNYSAFAPGLFREAPGRYPTQIHGVWTFLPQIQLAHQLGWSVRIREGWVWPRQRAANHLRGWSERLWEARQRLHALATAQQSDMQLAAAISLAEQLVKAIGVATIGRLGQRSGRQIVPLEDEMLDGQQADLLSFDLASQQAERLVDARDDQLYRPEWRSSIISWSNYSVMRALLEHAPAQTAGAYVDALYCLREIPQLAGNPMKPGGWHHSKSAVVPIEAFENVSTLVRAVR